MYIILLYQYIIIYVYNHSHSIFIHFTCLVATEYNVRVYTYTFYTPPPPPQHNITLHCRCIIYAVIFILFHPRSHPPFCFSDLFFHFPFLLNFLLQRFRREVVNNVTRAISEVYIIIYVQIIIIYR